MRPNEPDGEETQDLLRGLRRSVKAWGAGRECRDVGCSALAFVVCGYGLASLEVGQGAAFGNLKPLVGVGLAVLLGEPVTAGQLGGGALVLLGVALASGRPNPAPTGAVPSRLNLDRRRHRMPHRQPLPAAS